MHLSRFVPRFTVRRLMVAVTIVGLLIGVTIERHRRFKKIAARHRAEFEDFVAHCPYEHFSSHSERDMLHYEWLYALSVKYERAARHPWLPVGPDPPRPE